MRRGLAARAPGADVALDVVILTDCATGSASADVPLDIVVLGQPAGAPRADLSFRVVLFGRPDLTQLLNRHTAQPARPSTSLTESEHVVLRGLAAGLTLEQIAQDAQLSVRTVKRSRAALGEMLQATSPFLLGVKAYQLGLLQSDP